jgi:hypothetical protein
MVSKSGQGSNGSRLLSTSLCATRDEKSCVFTPESATAPLPSSSVPEGLPLRREVSVTSWNAEEEGVIFCESFGIDDWDVRLGRGVHL